MCTACDSAVPPWSESVSNRLHGAVSQQAAILRFVKLTSAVLWMAEVRDIWVSWVVINVVTDWALRNGCYRRLIPITTASLFCNSSAIAADRWQHNIYVTSYVAYIANWQTYRSGVLVCSIEKECFVKTFLSVLILIELCRACCVFKEQMSMFDIFGARRVVIFVIAWSSYKTEEGFLALCCGFLHCWYFYSWSVKARHWPRNKTLCKFFFIHVFCIYITVTHNINCFNSKWIIWNIKIRT
jgi:hypothetical protein